MYSPELEPEKELQAKKEEVAKKAKEAGQIAGKTILFVTIATIFLIWWLRK